MIQQQHQISNNNAQTLYMSAFSASEAAPLGNNTESAPTDHRSTEKRHHYKLLKTAQNYLREYRVGVCQKVPLGFRDADGKYAESTTISIGKTEHGHAKFGGLGHCGNLWQCPICARSSAAKTVSMVKTAMAENAKRGGQSLFITFTQPHQSKDELKSLISIQAKALSRMKASRQYRELMSFYGFIGEIRGLEITHGLVNGWHPHIHAIYLFDRITVNSDIDLFEKELYAMWAKHIVKAGGQIPSEKHGVDVRLPRSGSEDEIASYIAKWGEEVTMSHTKKGRGKESRTPFQILDDLSDGYNHRDYALMKQYAEATTRRARLYWSRGLKELFDVEEISDEEIANLPVAETKFEITWSQFKALRALDLQGDVLDMSEYYPAQFCLDFIINVERDYLRNLEDLNLLHNQERRERKARIRQQTLHHLFQLQYGLISA